MMRIITGKAKGFRLETLPGDDTRPTTERVKEAVFSALQFDLPGRAVLDLFAGSGQMGLEALSRGAASCVFTDCNPAACDIIRRNAHGAKLDDAAQIFAVEAQAFCRRRNGRYDIAFLDPPYKAGLLPSLLYELEPLMRAGGTVVCETAAETVLPEAAGRLTLERSRRYGKTIIWLYRCDDTGEKD